MVTETARPRRLLVCGLNWLGDAIISLPALQAFRWENPAAELTVLTKPHLAPLWAMHAAPTRVVTLPADWAGCRTAIRDLRALELETAFVLPHSFRAALFPFLARIPQRIGLPGHFPRDFMLTEVRHPAAGLLPLPLSVPPPPAGPRPPRAAWPDRRSPRFPGSSSHGCGSECPLRPASVRRS